jgi:hypothetical protein
MLFKVEGTDAVHLLPPDLGEDHWGRIATEHFRHQEYCVDSGFEAERADERERGRFDTRRATYLLRTRRGQPIACSRLVAARGHEKMPMQLSSRFRKAHLFEKIHTPAVELGRTINRDREPKTKRDTGCSHYVSVFEVLATETFRDYVPYGLVEPAYLRLLQGKFSRDAFVPVSEKFTDVTPNGVTLNHQAFRINMGAWKNDLMRLGLITSQAIAARAVA